MTQEQKESLLNLARDMADKIAVQKWESARLWLDDDYTGAEDAKEWLYQIRAYLNQLQKTFPEILDVQEFQPEDKPYSLIIVNSGEEANGL